MQPFEFVKINVAEPTLTPVTIPAFVTVAIAGLLLVQVPPVTGLNVVIAPMHRAELPVMVAVGCTVIVTGLVGLEVHPDALSVKMNVDVPALTPVTIPELFTVATDALLLVHVPPVAGLSVVVFPMHVVLLPVMDTAGLAVIVTGLVDRDTQPEAVLVKVNVAVPALTPVTIPAFVTVAFKLLLLTQVPPDDGLNVVVDAIQIEVEPVIATVGLAFMVMGFVGFEVHPVELFVYVNVTVPPLTPVTTPPFVTVAIDVLLLAHVPPFVGLNVVVAPAQMVEFPVIDTVGLAFTVTLLVALDMHPVDEFVNVKLAVPSATPVTIPVFATVAMLELLLVHVPPVDGLKVVVVPGQMAVSPVIETGGLGLTVTGFVGLETQPVDELVNVKVADPALTPETNPALFTVAIELLLLTQDPPVVGLRVVVLPIHIDALPVIVTGGLAFIVIGFVGFDVHPVEEFVNKNVAEPPLTPVTRPVLLTVATAGLLLVHVPPLEGLNVVVAPAQMVEFPVIETVGLGFTVMAFVGFDTQPLDFVNIKVVAPALTPVTRPELFTVAMAGLLLLQVPPVDGLSVVVVPIHMLLGPVIATAG